MSETNEAYGERPPAAEGAEEITGGFFASILDIIIDPVKVFKRIERGLSWWKPFLLVIIINLVLGYVNLPFGKQAQTIAMQERGAPAEQIEQVVKFAWIGPLTTTIFIIIISFVLIGIIHVFISLMSSNARFSKLLGLMFFCSFIGTVGEIVKTIILRLRGLEGIGTMRDMNPSLSLNAVFTDSSGVLYALFESLGLFAIWQYVLLAIGSTVVFKMSTGKGVVTSVVWWLLSFVIAYVFLVLVGGAGR